jgi:hypothetical protein
MLCRCHSSSDGGAAGAPAYLARRWASGTGTKSPPDIGNLLLDIPLHLLKANQCGFE